MGVSFYKVSTTWSESTLTWKSRPTTGPLIAQLAAPPGTGKLTVDVSSAFADDLFDSNRSGAAHRDDQLQWIRLLVARGIYGAQAAHHARDRRRPEPDGDRSTALAHSDGFAEPDPHSDTESDADASSYPHGRAADGVTPSAIPPSLLPPTASPSARRSRRRPPRHVPTRLTPTDTPVAHRYAAANPNPTAAPLFNFSGHGTDHGVGMSQWGAKGRASRRPDLRSDPALLLHRSRDLDDRRHASRFACCWATTSGRVPTLPARITADHGGWRSDSFPASTSRLAATSRCGPASRRHRRHRHPTPARRPRRRSHRLSMAGSVTAFDATGATLASAVTTADVMVQAIDPQGILQMRHRDNDPKYKTVPRLHPTDRRANWHPDGQRAAARGSTSAASCRPRCLPPGPWKRQGTGRCGSLVTSGRASSRRASATLCPTRPTRSTVGSNTKRFRTSDAAILATANQVLTYNGTVISAVFHAASAATPRTASTRSSTTTATLAPSSATCAASQTLTRTACPMTSGPAITTGTAPHSRWLSYRRSSENA